MPRTSGLPAAELLKVAHAVSSEAAMECGGAVPTPRGASSLNDNPYEASRRDQSFAINATGREVFCNGICFTKKLDRIDNA
jgi:hypothetical protein